MKNYLPGLFLLAFILGGCKKEPNGGTTPVKFVTTTYKSLGTFNDQGKPDYLETKDMISKQLYNFVTEQLPEKSDVRVTHPEYLKNADLPVTAKSDVYITFVDEGTALTNTVGFYTYKTGSPPTTPADIENITYIFPNSTYQSSGAVLNRGDKVKLGTFESGVSIGFVLLANGWDATAKNVNNKAAHYCSNLELNPENRVELKPHTVLIDFPAENKVIIGFEDMNRTDPKCDHDFNDVVMYATVVGL
jgi:hypothetical protein